MNPTFRALADPARRHLLDRLHEQQGQTLSSLCDGLPMRRQSVTRHLKILEAAHLIAIEWQGREKLHYLNPLPIAEIGVRWIDKFSKSKVNAIIALKMALEENDDEPT